MGALSLRSRWQQSGSQILLMPKTSAFLSLHTSSFFSLPLYFCQDQKTHQLGVSWNYCRWPMGSFMPFQISLPFVDPGLRESTCMEADRVLDCATAGCFHHISALTGVLLAAVPAKDRASLQLLVVRDCLSEDFRKCSASSTRNQDWLQIMPAVGHK